MAGERTLPGIGLTGFWNLGDNTFKPGMDANLRLLSALVQPRVLSISATEPGAPTDGDLHIASGAWGGGAINDILIRDNAAWVVVTPVSGWKAFNVATSEDLSFDGSAWVGSKMLLVTDAALDRVLLNSDLSGRVILERDNAAAQTLTVNSGLTGTEPVTILNTGGGALTITAGASVTINSDSAKVIVATQYTSATLIPKGADVYHLIGALS